jgi:hypothetical protein
MLDCVVTAELGEGPTLGRLCRLPAPLVKGDEVVFDDDEIDSAVIIPGNGPVGFDFRFTVIDTRWRIWHDGTAYLHIELDSERITDVRWDTTAQAQAYVEAAVAHLQRHGWSEDLGTGCFDSLSDFNDARDAEYRRIASLQEPPRSVFPRFASNHLPSPL